MIIVEGQKLHCAICNKEIQLEEAIVLPNLPINGNNPLSIFSGAIVHIDCLKRHPLKIQLLNLYKTLSTYKYNKDFITGDKLGIKELGHVDNEIFTYFFTNDKKNPLYKFNCIVLNKNNLKKWKDYNYFIELLSELDKSKKWKGNGIKLMIEKLISPPKAPYSKQFLDKMKERHGDNYNEDEKKVINNPFKEEYNKLRELEVFEEKELEEITNSTIQIDQNQLYKTYKGNNYTEEEWKKFEKEQYQEYLRKKGRS